MTQSLINSHIQLPLFILSEFENSNNELYFYDFKTKRIKKGHSKTLNTEFGYYSSTTEEFLNKTVETPFSKDLKVLSETDFSRQVYFPQTIIENIYRYIHSLLARDPNNFKYFIKNAIHNQFLPKNEQHDLAVSAMYGLAQHIRLFTQEYIITFMVNKTNASFVLPSGGLFETKYSINCPITPSKAIVLIHEECPLLQQLINDGQTKIILVDSLDKVFALNRVAFQFEVSRGGRFIVAPNKDTLIDIVTHV